MVKGNKFKPGELPRKRQRTSSSAVTLQQQDESKPMNLPGSNRPATFLEVIMASRPAQPNDTVPRTSLELPNKVESLIADSSAKVGNPGGLSKKKKKRQHEKQNSHNLASKRQKPDLKQQAVQIKADDPEKEGGNAKLPDVERIAQKAGAKRKKPSKPKAGSSTKTPLVSAPEQKPALKPTANQRKKARKRARQRSSSDEALIGPSQEADISVVQAVRDNAAKAKGSKKNSQSVQKISGQGIGESKAGTSEGKKTLEAQKGRASILTGELTFLAPPSKGAPLSSNWASLKPLIGAGKKADASIKGSTPKEAAEAKRPEPTGSSKEVSQCVAVDCEMVGVGPHGIRSSLARVSIVNDQGNVLMDKFVRQKERVTDYRTRYSGIRPEDVTGSKAEPFAVVQKEAADFFKGRVLVGHAIQNDLKALLLSHPVKLIRDTARYPPLMRPAQPGRKPKPRALRHLAFEELGLGIQEGEHSPVEDARSALYLYQKNAKVWEQHLQRGTFHLLKAPGTIPEETKKGSGKTLAQYAAKDVMVDL